jgi:NAD(P)-dependent dehydrogenase (short-subunit alcohol dehydrogenase family)
MESTKTIVVIGAGTGLGNAIAERFGREGYRVALVARRADALETYVRDFATNDIDATGYAADVTDTDAFDKTIAAIQSELGDPDVVVYNVGITTPDEDPLTTQDVMRHFAADVVGAYQTIERFATDGFAAKGGAIVLTGGVFAVNPYPGYLCVSIDKAAVRALAQLKHDELKNRGIFVGSIMPCGVIGSNEHFAPANIAERYWEIVSRRDEVELRYE